MNIFFNKLAKYLPTSFNPLTWANDNFHVVKEGILYRSKTMSAKKLEALIQTYNIKTILILRYPNPKAYWYQGEKEIACKYGVELLVQVLNPRYPPSQEQLKNLYAIFEKYKNSLLIHCQAGADRTGLACAFWQLCQGADLTQALAQQTARQCHLKWYYPKMRKTIKYLHHLRQMHGSMERALDHYNKNDI